MRSDVRLPARRFSAVFDPLSLVEYASALRTELAEMRIDLETSNNFSEFEEVCGQINSKGTITEPFDGAFFDITPMDGLWIVGRQDGHIIHIQAMRRDSLEGITLATYWTKQFTRIHDGLPSDDHAPGSFEITGNVVYHGDLWIDSSLRGQGVAPLTCRLAHCLALVKWAPDYIYGFMADDLIRSGFHVREGFAKAQPRAISWVKTPSNIDPKDWLIWSSLEDILHMVKLGTE